MYLKAQESLHRTPGTISNQRSQLRKFLRELGSFDVTRPKFPAWLLASTTNPQTRRTRRDTIRSFFKWAIPVYLPEVDDPTVGWQLPDEPLPTRHALLDEDQIEAALDSEAGAMPCWIALAAYQGLNCKEIAALTTSRFDLEGKVPTLQIQNSPTGRPRTQFLHPHVMAALEQLPMPNGGRLFEISAQRIPREIADHMRDISASWNDLMHWYRKQVDDDGINFRRPTDETADRAPLALSRMTSGGLSTRSIECARAASASYRQALIDMSVDDRASYRGPTHELRQALVDVLHRLAPDDDVMSAPGFKLEAGHTTPTHFHRGRHIMKQRGIGDTARKPSEITLRNFDDYVANLCRATYSSSSMTSHTTATRAGLRQLKLHVDAVLGELLGVHG